MGRLAAMVARAAALVNMASLLGLAVLCRLSGCPEAPVYALVAVSTASTTVELVVISELEEKLRSCRRMLWGIFRRVLQ